MTDKNYKVVPFIPKQDSEDAGYGIPSEERFCVVNAETGEILDDAQGYGYRTPQKAHAAWSYKCTPASVRAANVKHVKRVQAWIKAQKGLVEAMEDEAFLIAKGSYGPGERFDAAHVTDLLDDLGITDRPYSSAEILRCRGKKVPK